MQFAVGAKSTFLDKEMDTTIAFPFPKEGMAALFTPARQIVSGTWVGTEDFQDLSRLNFADVLLDPEERHGAAQAFGIEERISFKISGGSYCAHCGLL